MVDNSGSSLDSDGESPKGKSLKRNYDYEDGDDVGDEEMEEERDEDFHRPSSPQYRHTRTKSRGNREENGDMEDDEDGDEDTSVVSSIHLIPILLLGVTLIFRKIRCACGNNVDFGLMIQCEMCDVWQHAGCVGIKNQAAIPSHYYCERCKPRSFNCGCGKVIFGIVRSFVLFA